jgi:DNA-binding transcriptional LysR family regulator
MERKGGECESRPPPGKADDIRFHHSEKPAFLRGMNTRFLATFCAVAEAGSLAGAARRLNLANASVSEQIAALERTLNATLLMRRGRSVVLTEAGQAILEAAADIVARVEALRPMAQLGQLSGQLRVGAISTALVSIVPPALRAMAEQHPRIELKVLPGTSAQLYRMLEAGELDCALTVRPHFTLPKSIEWQDIRREPMVLLTPATMPGEDPDALLRAAPLIRIDREAWTGRLVNRYLRDRDFPVRELFELDAQEAIVILVAQGMGVALLPDWGIVPPAGPGIRRWPVGQGQYDRVIGLAMAHGPRGKLARSLADALLHAAAAETRA